MKYLFVLLLFCCLLIPCCKTVETKQVSNINVPIVTEVTPSLKDNLSFIDNVVRHTLTLYDQDDTKHYRQYISKESDARTLYILNVTNKYYIPHDRDINFVWVWRDSEYREDLDFAYIQSNNDNLKDEAEYYRNAGYDVFWRSTTSYNSSSGSGSTVTDSFIKQSRYRQAFTIGHEMCHEWNAENVSSNYPSALDESECMVRGYLVALSYFKDNGNENDYQDTLKSFNRERYWAKDLMDTVKRLEIIYNDDTIEDYVKDRIRQETFNAFSDRTGAKIVNNARFFDYIPYIEYFVEYDNLYAGYDYDIKKVLRILKESPDNEKDAIKYILGKTLCLVDESLSSTFGLDLSYIKMDNEKVFNDWQMH